MLQCASHNWWTCAPARNRKQFAKLSPASLCMHEEEEEEGGGGGRRRHNTTGGEARGNRKAEAGGETSHRSKIGPSP
ncbi:unnamed protein product [Prorocentrum cordatum]|uniref:Uncharacterized protein n=1 Tax=Prorocentrum cordatum TaxID=2364126 RepID=A0ABN9XET6_9DINO|nr:unnamed protein product [Polarella glacialis]